VASISQFLRSKEILVDATEDAKYFAEDSLKNYSAVIFLSTTGNVFDSRQQVEFERYIQAGGGFVGIHAASDTEYNWPWYNKLVGAYFDGHPPIQDAILRNLSREDPCCSHLPEEWKLNEEWYNFKAINPNIEILVEIDESSYNGGTHGKNHPMVWRHNYDGGRSFYTAIGHKDQTFDDPLFLNQIFAGIQFAIGENRLDYTKSKSVRIPEENRFSKKVLDFNLDEPMELDELGDRGIVYIERKGAVKLYEYESKEIKILDSIKVFHENEDGLLGIAVDPNFNNNNWIYLFYSPQIDKPIQHVSRFTLNNDKLTDEKVILEIPVIRKCCHSGGSLEFGNDGLLYIGVGDNTNPFESKGFAPIDERKDRQLFDAQRSASSTNDLRGKILRIKPESNGSYSIPDGNLFEKGKEKCSPEIYVMGVRNPFRFSIDQKTHQMYFDFDFETNISGSLFNAKKVINNSPNNTGLKKLPPIEESTFWYGYRKSTDFPWLGEGGVNPMSGPIFHSENFENTLDNFPSYFDNKWFVYEWMRDWIYVVSLDENDDYLRADPFMSQTEFSHPMDMIFSKNGELYILEYGQKWNARNIDARLSVISYNGGNRTPVASIKSDKEVGAVPLEIHFSADHSYDYDQDQLEFQWFINGDLQRSKSESFIHTFKNPGRYEVNLKVIDEYGGISSMSKMVMAGNERPKLTIGLSDSNTIYKDYKSIDYSITVEDLEDGNSQDASLDISKVKVTLNYIPEGKDIILASIGHQQNVEPKGLQLINTSGCKACHGVSEKVAGPSYQDVAQRYDKKDQQMIVRRIIKGSQGVWGENMMAAHPQLSIEEVDEMVNYILSLGAEDDEELESLALSGSIRFDQHLDDIEPGKYILMSSYLDNGNPNLEGSELSVVDQIVFSPEKFELEDAIDLDPSLGVWESQGRTLVGSIKHGKFFEIGEAQLNDLAGITLGGAFSANYKYMGKAELRLDTPDGELLGSSLIQYFDSEKEGFNTFKINIKTRKSGIQKLFLVFKNEQDIEQYVLNADWLKFNYID